MSITVYHGSSQEIKIPSLDHGRKDADFGVGFYVTCDVEMAEKWASRKHKSVVNIYKIDFAYLTGIEFQLDKAWLDFICQNRSGIPRIDINVGELDYITGATADDKLFAVIEQYESNLMDADTAIECMNAMKIGIQTALVSQTAVDHLLFTGSYELTESRKNELDMINRQARQETNRVVDQVMRDRVQRKNEEPVQMPQIHRRRK